MQAAYVSAAQMPQMVPARQNSYAVDGLGRPLMGSGYLQEMVSPHGQHYGHPSMGQTIPGGILLQPQGFPPHHPGYHQGAYMTQPPIVHLPGVGDISSSSYMEGEMPRFSRSGFRMRSQSITSPQGVPVIPLGMNGHYLSQSGVERETPYFMDCHFCQIGHPGWHPASPTTPIHMMPRNHMQGMEDTMSLSSISSMALAHPSQQPLYDPLDSPWPPGKVMRGRDSARDFYINGLKRSGSINASREISSGFSRVRELDSDQEGNDDDIDDRESRPSLPSINIRRQSSRRNLRASSRPRSTGAGYV